MDREHSGPSLRPSPPQHPGLAGSSRTPLLTAAPATFSTPFPTQHTCLFRHHWVSLRTPKVFMLPKLTSFCALLSPEPRPPCSRFPLFSQASSTSPPFLRVLELLRSVSEALFLSTTLSFGDCIHFHSSKYLQHAHDSKVYSQPSPPLSSGPMHLHAGLTAPSGYLTELHV